MSKKCIWAGCLNKASFSSVCVCVVGVAFFLAISWLPPDCSPFTSPAQPAHLPSISSSAQQRFYPPSTHHPIVVSALPSLTISNACFDSKFVLIVSPCARDHSLSCPPACSLACLPANLPVVSCLPTPFTAASQLPAVLYK